MIKLSARRLNTVEGQAGIVAAMELEQKLGNAIAFTAQPSFKELLEQKLKEFPYSDNLMRILAHQDCRLYESRNAVRDYLRGNMHRVRTLPALVDLLDTRSISSNEEYNSLIGNVDTEVMHAAIDIVRGSSLLDFMLYAGDRYHYYGATTSVVPLPPTPRMVLTTVHKQDLRDSEVRQAMQLCEKLCFKHYPELFRGVIYHLNNQVRRFVRTGQESVPSVCNTFERWMRPSPRADEMAMVMWDPKDPDLLAHFIALRAKEDE